jgi:replicative DNA helicase
MSKEHYDLETLALAHITKSTKSIDLFLERKITAEHFTYVSDGESVSYTQGLFNMIVKYYEQSGGSLFTSYILDQKLKNKKVKESSKAKLLTLWEDIENTDVDDNNLYEVLQQLKNRRCNALLSEMLTDSYNSIASQDIKTTLSVIQDNVDKIQDELSEFGADRHAFDVTQSGDFFKDEYEKRIKHPELFKGIDCGVSNIDSKTFGWLPGQIIVFLAPSSGGKSVMLLNSAMHANKNCNKKVLYMSFEMNSWLCLLRHISLSFEIPYSQLKDNNLSPDELRAIVDGLNNSKDGAYFEYDVNMEDPTPEYIDSRIRELIATKGKPDLLVVDYIGNMTVRNAVNGSKN